MPRFGSVRGFGGLGAVKSAAELIDALHKMSDADLALVASGKDPEGGPVPADFAKLAQDEQAARAAIKTGADVPTGGGGINPLVVLGGLAVLGWLVFRKR